MWKREPPCGTYGCTLPDKHRGLHCLPHIGKRRGASSFDILKHAVVPKLKRIKCDDERDDLLITDPLEDFFSRGHLSPPPLASSCARNCPSDPNAPNVSNRLTDTLRSRSHAKSRRIPSVCGHMYRGMCTCANTDRRYDCPVNSNGQR